MYLNRSSRADEYCFEKNQIVENIFNPVQTGGAGGREEIEKESSFYVTSLTLVFRSEHTGTTLSWIEFLQRNGIFPTKHTMLVFRTRRGHQEGRQESWDREQCFKFSSKNDSLAIDQPRDWLMATERKKRTETTEMDCVTPTESA